MNTTTTYTDPAPPRRDVPRWILELEPIQPPRNPERELARALKALSRAYNLRCRKVRTIDQHAADGDQAAPAESEGDHA